MDKKQEPGSMYSHYVLGILFIIYIFNFIDRQILSILAEELKRDIGITDAQLGFLYGTAFAVFYAIFGIPLGRLADSWNRRKLISLGLFFWSLMTALSGTARSFLSLGAYRIGVGIGEASATPAALSMLSDYYPKAVRATVMAIYSSGIYVGGGIGLVIGGLTVDRWNAAYPDVALAPFGLTGWQVAFFIVGLPGILMALWVWTLREPVRGAVDGIESPKVAKPFTAALGELIALIPPFSFSPLLAAGGTRAHCIQNLIVGAGIALAAASLIWVTGSIAQWVALGAGLYAVFSWLQVNRMRDKVGFELMFRTPSAMLSVLGFSWLAFVSYGVTFWAPVYLQRAHGASPGEVGQVVGISAAVAGGIGVILGGVLSDLARRKIPVGRLYIAAGSAALTVPFQIYMLTTDSLTGAYIANVPALLLTPMWIGVATSTVTDLMLPRLRALALAVYILTITFIGLALGPYCIGFLSSVLDASGMDAATALRYANLAAVAFVPLGVGLILLASRFLVKDEAGMLSRARALGEPGLNSPAGALPEPGPSSPAGSMDRLR